MFCRMNLENDLECYFMCMVVYILVYIKRMESILCMIKFKVVRYELQAINTH